jgi:hypothetical protein
MPKTATDPPATPRLVQEPAFVGWRLDRGTWIVQAVGESPEFIEQHFAGVQCITPFGHRPQEDKRA